jgi:hypothetical protein
MYLLAFSLSASCQGNEEQMIAWKESRPLTWDDYKGRPDTNSDAAASTSTFLKVEFHVSQGEFSYSIQCAFSPAQSWGRSKTPGILKHEQGHFDITEVFARKLHQQLVAYRFNPSSYKTDLSQIYNTITREKEKFQDQYDRETDHSRKPEEQEKWSRKIAGMLKELKDYAGY